MQPDAVSFDANAMSIISNLQRKEKQTLNDHVQKNFERNARLTEIFFVVSIFFFEFC